MAVRHTPAAGQRTNPASQQRRSESPQPWWWRHRLALGAVAVVAVVVLVLIAVANNQNQQLSAGLLQPLPAQVQREVTSVNPSVLSTVGTGGLTDPLRAISGPALSSNGKPEFLYIGAEFCPYCAAERWSLVNALSRFGTFSGLRTMRSAANDGNYATVTFRGSTYTSQYLSFVPVENEDRAHNPLQPLTSQQSQLFSSLGGNGYPFLDIAGQYANDAPNTYSSGYDPTVLTGLNWTQIAGKLSNPSDPVTRGIIGNANYLTAAICKVTNNAPASACSSQTIQQIEGTLP